MSITTEQATETVTLDDHAAALIWLAGEHLQHYPELDPVITLLVSALAHPDVVGVAPAHFELLVEAVREQQRFNGNPRSWADENGWPASERAIENLDEQLQSAVDHAVWDLLHVAAPCARCRYARPRSFWRVALPESIFCASHQDAAA